MIKRILALSLAIAMMVPCLTGCTSNGVMSVSGKKKDSNSYSLVFASQDSEGLPTTEAMYWIAEQVKDRTNGAVDINVYPANQYGSADVLYQGIMDGSVDMYLGYLDPTYDEVFDTSTIPFLASNFDEMSYICSEDSNIYKLFAEHMEATDMHFLGFFMNGVNGIFSAKDLGDYLNPDEKKDALIRIANSETYQLGVQALGYSTITIPYTDTYTSLQTGVMDGMTGIPSYMVHQNFADVTKYYLAMDMYMEANVIMMSPKTVDKLPEEYVDVITQVCKEASEQSLITTEENVNQGIEDLKSDGVEILPITDEERSEVAKEVHEKIDGKLADYFGADVMAQIQEDMENAQAYAASKK